jgi:hypothetical protein
VDEFAQDAALRGYAPTVVVLALAGELPLEMRIDARRHITPDWDLRGDLRGKPGIIGEYAGLPLLEVRESEVSALYVVDLLRLGTLEIFTGSPEFEIREFDHTRAAEMLRERPNLVEMPTTGPDQRPDTELERIRQLQLKVGLRLFESAWFDPKSIRATPAIQVARLAPDSQGQAALPGRTRGTARR